MPVHPSIDFSLVYNYRVRDTPAQTLESPSRASQKPQLQLKSKAGVSLGAFKLQTDNEEVEFGVDPIQALTTCAAVKYMFSRKKKSSSPDNLGAPAEPAEFGVATAEPRTLVWRTLETEAKKNEGVSSGRVTYMPAKAESRNCVIGGGSLTEQVKWFTPLSAEPRTVVWGNREATSLEPMQALPLVRWSQYRGQISEVTTRSHELEVENTQLRSENADLKELLQATARKNTLEHENARLRAENADLRSKVAVQSALGSTKAWFV